jgi:hypothetical protein
VGHQLPICASTHAIAEAPGRSTHDRLEVVPFLKNQDGPCSSYLCGNLANFVDAASRAIQIAQAYGDSVYPAAVAVSGELNASLHMLPQFLIPADISRSNSDVHCYLLSLFVR